MKTKLQLYFTIVCFFKKAVIEIFIQAITFLKNNQLIINTFSFFFLSYPILNYFSQPNHFKNDFIFHKRVS